MMIRSYFERAATVRMLRAATNARGKRPRVMTRTGAEDERAKGSKDMNILQER